MHKRFLKRFILITVLLFAGHLLNSTTALAHKGHAGPTKVLVEETEALKTMLPEGDKLIKRKELLKKEKHNDAVKHWGYSPDEGVYSYYISKDKAGNLSGALFIRDIEYKHGSVGFAVGYNKTGEITDIKILSCSEKYLKEVAEDIQSNGFLDNFFHLKTDDVISKGKTYDKEPHESLKYIIAKEIEGTAVLLKLFQGK